MAVIQKLEKELTAVVQQMTECQTVDEVYFGLMRRERQLKTLLYKSHEPAPPKGNGKKYKLWAEWEMKLLRLQYKDKEAKELASVFGVSETAVHRKANAIGLVKLHNKPKK